MQLTLYTDYSLRVLIYLGVNPERQVTITEIAESYGISRNHLVKVVHNLSGLGYIRTVRGRGGGMLLARIPEDINIGDVVKRTEPNFDIVECFDRKNDGCAISAGCALIKPLKMAKQAFIDVLANYTIADVVSNRDELVQYLSIDSIGNRSNHR